MSLEGIAQSVVGIACVVAGLVGLARKAGSAGKGLLPWAKPRERTPVDDLRLVIELAARLRDSGKTEAVAACQRLVDELLKPGVQTP